MPPEFSKRKSDSELVAREQQQKDRLHQRDLAEFQNIMDGEGVILIIDMDEVRKVFLAAFENMGEMHDPDLFEKHLIANLENEHIHLDTHILREVMEELFDDEILDEYEEPHEVWEKFEQIMRNKVVVRDE